MRGYFSVLLCGTLGLLAALLLTSTGSAGTVTVQDLSGLGYSLSARGERIGAIVCTNYYVIGGNSAPETLLGILLDANHPECKPTPDDVMQQRIDALLAAYPPQPPTTAPPTPVPTLSPSTVTVTVPTTIMLSTTVTVATTTTVTSTVTERVPVEVPVTTTVMSPPATVTVRAPTVKPAVKVTRPAKKAKRKRAR